MKLIISVLCIIALSGCSYQEVESGAIIAANKLCERHLGINEITSWNTGTYSTKCNDGYRANYLTFPKD